MKRDKEIIEIEIRKRQINSCHILHVTLFLNYFLIIFYCRCKRNNVTWRGADIVTHFPSLSLRSSLLSSLRLSFLSLVNNIRSLATRVTVPSGHFPLRERGYESRPRVNCKKSGSSVTSSLFTTVTIRLLFPSCPATRSIPPLITPRSGPVSDRREGSRMEWGKSDRRWPDPPGEETGGAWHGGSLHPRPSPLTSPHLRFGSWAVR